MDRSKFIGGSEIAAIMGLNPWTTPLQVWGVKTGNLPPTEMNEAMELGTELEDFVAQKFARKTGMRVRRDRRSYRHKKYDFLGAHIDRRVAGDEKGYCGILECKTCSAYLAKEWQGDEIPDAYIMQVQWYLGILEETEAWIACLIGGQKFVYKKIAFNQSLFDSMVSAAVRFWNDFIVPGVPPVATAGDKDALLSMYPESGESVRVVSGDEETEVNGLVDTRLGGKEQLAQIEKEIESAENRLRQLCGEDGYIQTGQYKVSWKSQGKSKVNTEKMKTDGIYETYVERGTTRVLRTTSNQRREQ